MEDIISPLLKAVLFAFSVENHLAEKSKYEVWLVGVGQVDMYSSGCGPCTGGHRDYHDDQSQHVSDEDTGDHQIMMIIFSSSIVTATLTEE